MKPFPRRRRSPMVVALSLLASLTLLLAVPVFADTPNGAAGAAMAGAFLLVFCVVFVLFYIYWALALQTIAHKTNTDNAWYAWIPIIQVILMLNIAKKPVWWIILFFIPIVNIVISIIVFMAIAEARNKPSWWGILMIVPVVNLIVPGYLAWAD
jgi:uncharacterized membrane protein YhaH (DUF805 family)